jgi:hypothetical protein
MALSGGTIGLDVDLRRIRKDAYSFRQGPEKVTIEGRRLVRQVVDEARSIMTAEIGSDVYAIPPTSYIRTQRLWQGVRSREFTRGIAAGEVFIDPSIGGHNDYFYPVSVEFGLRSHPRYFGRRYWERGFPKVVIMFKERARQIADDLRRDLSV